MIALATADIIAKIAHGLADEVLTCTILATDAPVVVVPSMNDKMLANSFTQENIQKLKKSGMEIVAPVKGPLACGYEADGHIAENKAILQAVCRRLKMK